jgi:hypothetical protein
MGLSEEENVDFVIIKKISATIHLFLVVLAVVLAVTCNKKGERFGPVLASLFVPEIYLMQRGIRQFILKEPDYGCYGAGSGSVFQ